MSAKAYYDANFQKSVLRSVFHSRIRSSTSVGLDGISAEKYEEILELEEDIILRKVSLETYKFTRFKEKLILKGHGKPPRQLGIPTTRDKLVLKIIHEIIKCVYDQKFDKPQKIISEIKQVLGMSAYDCFVRVDVKNFYPSIDHSKLLSRLRAKVRVRQLLTLIEKAISTEIGNSGTKAVGVPQGLSISNLLSNIFLSRFDSVMDKQSDKINFYYFRYVDDILIVTNMSAASEILTLVQGELRKDGLEAHQISTDEGKTIICPMSEELDYLGYSFSADVVTVKTKSLQRMYDNLLKAMSRFHFGNKADNSVNLFRFNLKITGCVLDNAKLGWVHFFSEITSVYQLHALDAFVNKHALRKVPVKERSEIKSFVRAYYEIKHNYHETSYIPDFDKFNIDKKIETIALILMKHQAEIVNWDDDKIEITFKQLLDRETRRLEADIPSY